MTPSTATDALLIAVDTPKPIGRVREDLLRACQKHAFGVLGVHDLRAKLNEKGVPHERDCLVFEVCNPHQAKRALDASPEIANLLPCRIAVFPAPEGGGTRLSTIRPTKLLALFGAPGIVKVAEEVERSLDAIIVDAATE